MFKIEGLRRLEFGIKKTNQLDRNGFMTIEGIATIADRVMEYIDKDNDRVTKEVIPLDELIKSQNSIVGIPVTNEHPWMFVDSRNATDYTKGMIIENLGIKNKELKIKAKILDSNLITEIMKGKDKLSIGYWCDLEEKSGITEDGVAYTHIQSNIDYNHLGIVYIPRAGEDARITKLNSKDGSLAYSRGLKEQFEKINSRGSEQMTVWKINGKDYNEQELFAETMRLNSENEDLKKQNSSLEGEKSVLEGQLAVEKKNSAEATEKLNGMEEEIQKRLNSKMELINAIKVNGLNIEGIEKMNELDIKKEVIKKNGMEEMIADKDENFINGVYLALMKNNSKDPIETKANSGDGGKTEKTNSMSEAWEKARKGEGK